uniref:hypothetical protein n=1 Tax=Ulva meridionalis TaxID=434723 RepID=UPI00211451D8|nr:hypothetical protein NQY40_mgp41 [Ulva meridionalis]UTA96515.1 hypothetical protein [Ulva meridionalis]UTA96573.1 hypothetical protein [Ulva meridionalis]UTA96741.1 hypothetical protein [Ulva meridionalis]
MISQLLTVSILLSMLIPIINWALSLIFTQVKLPRALFVFTETILIVATLLAIIATLLDYHSMINRQEYEPILNTPLTIFGPYLACLAIIQMFYVRQQYRISFIFTTNLVTLGLALPVLYFLPPLLYTMPIVLYYGVHTFILTICDLFYWDHDKVSAFIRKQTWVNKINLLENMLPKKNINAYILSSAASFCYSSLNLCILVSFKEMGIAEYTALCLTCVILILTAIISFALLVKYDDVGNEPFPGCLLIHFITQAYKRCENILYSEQSKSYTKFTFRSVVFAILLIVDALGSTSYAMTAQIGEQNEIIAGQEQQLPVAESRYSAFGDTLRRTFSLPNMRSAAGSVGAGVTSAYIYDQVITHQSTEDPQVTIARLQEQVKAKDELLLERQNRIEFLENQAPKQQVEVNKKSFFNSLFACFKK